MRQRIALTIFLLTPLLLLGVVLLGIHFLRPEMNAPPVGAGAGSTGGANAIGEYLAHGSAKRHDLSLVSPESLSQGFVIEVTDESGLAGPASPIYLACNLNGWNAADPAFKLSPEGEGRWRIALAQPQDARPMEFKFTRGSWDLEELDASLSTISNRTLPKVDSSKLAFGEQPVISLSVLRWGDQRPTTPTAGTSK
jgi:hypothetical protein